VSNALSWFCHVSSDLAQSTLTIARTRSPTDEKHTLRRCGVTDHRESGLMVWAAESDVAWGWAQISASPWACHWQ
jgi:hypothetical protein